ncbi:hypothetical protein A3J44_05200 [candidate division WOR-1 bacterium RIFCSPHIGHO2_02_FULL_45_12]|nr:MAG: hypothetical protein A3J44_05200 [candidate division WOR-1 bacterium RIFCSPHIGHO2_02_FULL_45_12]
MKKLIILLFVFTLFVGAAVAQDKGDEQVFGKLSVYSDVPDTDIYVDARYIGRDRASMSNISVGKHYVRVVKGEKSLLSGIVDVKEGEETVVVAKVEADSLEESRRKSNYVFFYGGITSVGFNLSRPDLANGVSSFPYSSQYGIGMELQQTIPNMDVNFDAGFSLNLPSKMTFMSSEEAGWLWRQGYVAIAAPYVSLSKEIASLSLFKINFGAGLNYAIYIPGGGVAISLEPRLGYMVFLEGVRRFENERKFIIRTGFLNYAGAVSVQNVSSPGFYLQSGMAYEL